ncbi:hypothetical protein DL98DRAFT_591029 [Cadophora sp. DSE1049]|nr:hypothetical protein DL98DRAFT_591029 [Cadophora sp. DSE1049]
MITSLMMPTPADGPLLVTSIPTAVHEDGTLSLSNSNISCLQAIPNLSAEIRIIIWRFAAYQPRLIEIGHAKSRGTTSLINPLSRKPNAIFHTSKESREEALKFYQITEFYGRPLKSARALDNHPKLYFNPRVDVIYFGRYTSIDKIIEFLRYLPLTTVTKIPHVAVHYELLLTAAYQGPQICRDFLRPSVLSIEAQIVKVLHGLHSHLHATKVAEQ